MARAIVIGSGVADAFGDFEGFGECEGDGDGPPSSGTTSASSRSQILYPSGRSFLLARCPTTPVNRYVAPRMKLVVASPDEASATTRAEAPSATTSSARSPVELFRTGLSIVPVSETSRPSTPSLRPPGLIGRGAGSGPGPSGTAGVVERISS